MNSSSKNHHDLIKEIKRRQGQTPYLDLYSNATIELPWKDVAVTPHTWTLSHSGELELQRHGRKVYLVQYEAAPSRDHNLMVENTSGPGIFGLWVRFQDKDFMNAKIRFLDADLQELEVVDVPKHHADEVLVSSTKPAVWAHWSGDGALFWAVEQKAGA